MKNIQNKVPTPLQNKTGLKHFKVKGDTGEEYELGYEELGWYESDKLTNDTADINAITKTMKVNIPEFEMQAMLRTLKEAPFDITKENLLTLDKKIVKQILNVVLPKEEPELEKKSDG